MPFKNHSPILIISFEIFRQCWNSCSPTSTDASTESVIDDTSSTSWMASDTIQLDVHSMFREGSLVMADIVWNIKYEPIQCLVTWETFGSSIMGNLLTDTAEAQLSLWPDSKYHLQVTCKNKVRKYGLRVQLNIIHSETKYIDFDCNAITYCI